MTPYFNLNILKNCTLHIKDITQEIENEYLGENDEYLTPDKFKYSDTYTVNIITYVHSKKEEEIVETIITPHMLKNEPVYLDEAYHTIKKDGHYVVYHMIVPSKTWAEGNTDFVKLHAYMIVTDGTDFYKYQESQFVKCTTDDLLDFNPTSKEIFSTCLLHKCYLDKCKDDLTNLIHNRCAKNNANSQTNLIWIILNAIRYNVDLGYFKQAQTILEDVLSCYNPCNTIHKNNECGCS